MKPTRKGFPKGAIKESFSNETERIESLASSNHTQLPNHIKRNQTSLSSGFKQDLNDSENDSDIFPDYE